ncbi:acetylornithine deacetylase [Achromobacter ruhlandii]|uniref:Acetylornithine deacetylase n=1 Tax=Achromobacter ruhlandii TaxID=72557 RepID=A0ABM8LZC2_9BURK|nr:acetylornithine deacetylase [Achromobacter ruhlandii]AKP91967.1 Acetylornithine deacetylase [Achromobacter xylosoxidans]AOU95203.1 acetylornithine deacetylase [Achromobacter ruhlandii]MCZ8431418.1 acetylornithine deacetylase [Achromobacter ruhlandii]MDC6091262.1 acetylornithine deacetylase [Achromobacter ruhlandii]MDC6149720.1 acetylornithine deacetylase [Achromobacter ruhlandii]
MSRLLPPDSLALLRELIAFPSVTLTSNASLMDRVQEVLEQAGIASMRVPDPRDATRCNLYASVGPSDVPGILLSGHTDVVPVEGQPWTTPPFEASERDGRLYGRGAADMKGFVACAVMAMARAARRPLKRPLSLALSFDEEIGCVGVRHLLRELEGLEPQPLLCVVGEPTLMQIGTGHKGKAAYRAHCCGQAGHSGLAPRFVNAIHTATDLVGALRDVQRELAEQGPREEGYAIAYSTVHAGTIRGGTALNIVPADCEVDFEIRNVAQDEPQRILARVLERTRARMREAQPLADAALPDIVPGNAYPGLSVPPDSPAVRLLASMLPPGTPCTKVAFGTEGGLFGQLWARTSVLVCGPGSIEVAHKADEYVEISQIEACDAMLARLTDYLCG